MQRNAMQCNAAAFQDGQLSEPEVEFWIDGRIDRKTISFAIFCGFASVISGEDHSVSPTVLVRHGLGRGGSLGKTRLLI